MSPLPNCPACARPELLQLRLPIINGQAWTSCPTCKVAVLVRVTDGEILMVGKP